MCLNTLKSVLHHSKKPEHCNLQQKPKHSNDDPTQPKINLFLKKERKTATVLNFRSLVDTWYFKNLRAMEKNKTSEKQQTKKKQKKKKRAK